MERIILCLVKETITITQVRPNESFMYIVFGAVFSNKF